MRTRSLGNTGVQISVVGFGAMSLSLRDRPAEDESVRIVKQVLAAGVNFIDTADTYCLGPGDVHHNEQIVARGIAQHPSSVLVATKGGTRRTDHGWQVDAAPDRLYRSICDSFESLGGRNPIPLWQLHWPDPRYTIAEMMAPVLRAQQEKLVQFVGVCNFSAAQLKEAQDILPLVSVQNQFNLWHREAERDGVIEYCQQQGLIFLPWRPLGGLGLSHRLNEIAVLDELARERGLSPQRLMIAWHLAKSPCIVPIPGSCQWGHILDCLAACTDRLEPAEIRRLDGVSAGDLPQRERPSAWEGMPPLCDD